ncbi:MAG: hypothetical protein FWH40_04840 [Coriobacteriia bacterium]|nr:hypothetical protein [Coriobacteriia bacterium]
MPPVLLVGLCDDVYHVVRQEERLQVADHVADRAVALPWACKGLQAPHGAEVGQEVLPVRPRVAGQYRGPFVGACLPGRTGKAALAGQVDDGAPGDRGGRAGKACPLLVALALVVALGVPS